MGKRREVVLFYVAYILSLLAVMYTALLIIPDSYLISIAKRLVY